MKHIITLIITTCLATLANAQTANIMPCNASGNTCTPYTTLQDAYTAASTVDIIYLPAGSFTMPLLFKSNT
jgi:hypothetical protein